MILSSGSSSAPLLAPGGALLIAGVAVVLYLLAALPATFLRGEGLAALLRRFSAAALLGAWVLHLLLLVIDIGGFGQAERGARLGFGPVLSMTVWLLIAVHGVESRFLPLPSVRLALGLVGSAAVLVALLFPGEVRALPSKLAPLHFALGVGSYGLFAAAVLHGLLLDAAERRLRSAGGAKAALLLAAQGAPGAQGGGEGRGGMPLLQLERITFRFVEAGFVVLTATLALGAVTAGHWRFDHKSVFASLAWIVFAALLVGRHQRGWRGRRATRWLYVGALLLLLAYVGSRFVFEVVLGRPPA
jgi:ABC-type uncharacterized transport system permease subunit